MVVKRTTMETMEPMNAMAGLHQAAGGTDDTCELELNFRWEIYFWHVNNTLTTITFEPANRRSELQSLPRLNCSHHRFHSRKLLCRMAVACTHTQLPMSERKRSAQCLSHHGYTPATKSWARRTTTISPGRRTSWVSCGSSGGTIMEADRSEGT